MAKDKRKAKAASRLKARKGPFGFVDTPVGSDVSSSNSVHLEGWALDRHGIREISVEREPRPGDDIRGLNERGLIIVGLAKRVIGSRPDVMKQHPKVPESHSAGWTFEVKRQDISSLERFRVSLHIMAHSISGRCAEIGCRTISFEPDHSAKPFIFCGRPFDSVFISSNGDVNPYPDCRPERPFGSIATDTQKFSEIWHGPEFRALRENIIRQNPPAMCLNCAHFINRNVDDPSFFISR